MYYILAKLPVVPFFCSLTQILLNILPNFFLFTNQYTLTTRVYIFWVWQNYFYVDCNCYAQSTHLKYKCFYDNEYNASKYGQYIWPRKTKKSNLYNTIFAKMTFPHLNMIFGHAHTIGNNSATFSNPGQKLNFLIFTILCSSSTVIC